VPAPTPSDARILPREPAGLEPAAPGCDPGLRDLTPAVMERVAVAVEVLLGAKNRFAMLAGLTNNDAFLSVIS
jgi:hypothetical protein